MTEKSNIDKLKFREYWGTLGRYEKIEMRKKIMSACYVEYPTVTNWLHGFCAIPPLAKEKIEEVVGEEIFG